MPRVNGQFIPAEDLPYGPGNPDYEYDGDVMDRDQIFDLADDAEAANHQMMLEREHRLIDALDECVTKGVSRDSLRVLAMETGACSWSMRQSLKG